MFERIKYMLIKEFIQIYRDPKIRAIIFVIPIIQTLVFGYAVTTDVKHVATAVYDLDQSVMSRDVVAALTHSGYFDVVSYLDSPNQIIQTLDRGEALIVLYFRRGFEEKIKANQPAPLQVLLDGTDANTANIAYSYVTQMIRTFSNQIVVEKLPPHFQRAGIELESRAWFNSNLESRNFYIPGVVASLITLMTLTLTSMAIVREKEVGTIEQMMVSPVTPLEFILGKTIPFTIIGFIDVMAILIVAVYWFEVPIRGSVSLLFLGVGLYLLTTLGIGLFISTISQTQQQAMMSALLFYMPAVLLSGFIYPIANMPVFIQWMTYFNPLKYFLIMIRGIFLKGIGIEILWPQFLILGLMGGSIIWISSKRVLKTLT